MTIAWTMQSALVFIAIALWIGDVVASLTKARVPSILIIAIIFVVGYWTILPQDFLDIALITYFYQFVNFVIMVHIGTLFNLRELKSEWKVVVITLAAVVGIVITVYLLGQYIPWVGKAQALAMAPPFTGGLMAALIMGEAGNAAGMPALGTLSSICFIMQGFVGFPLTALFLKKEATRVLGEIDKGSWVVEEKKEESEQKKALVDRVPEKLKGNYWYILELCFYGWIAKLLSDFLNTTFNSTLWSTSITGIVVGILAAALGILDTSPMNKAQSYGFLNWALTAYFMSFLKTATAQLLLSLVVPLVTGLALATVGIFIGSILLGTSKIVGFSKPMALAVGLNCFLGFPYNFILVKECIASLECSEERKETVENHLMPKMILGSVIAVSIVSVLIAGILAPVVMAMGA